MCVCVQGVTTTTVRLDGSLNPLLLDKFLQSLLWDKDIRNRDGDIMTVLRLKVW